MLEEFNVSGARPSGLRSAIELGGGRPHGDRMRYMAGCRCVECRRANTSYEKARSLARKAGDWNGFVSAEKSRQHILALRAAGVGRDQVADAASVATSIIVKISAGDRAQVRARTERAILSVTVDALADRALIDAAPSWKLLDELHASGYTKAELARQLGYQREALQLGREQCTVRNAHQVKRLYERLRRVPAQLSVEHVRELREEGYNPLRIAKMVADLAARGAQACPDLTVHGEFIAAAAADLLGRLHAELTREPA
jgi:hypothetical protein